MKVAFNCVILNFSVLHHENNRPGKPHFRGSQAKRAPQSWGYQPADGEPLFSRARPVHAQLLYQQLSPPPQSIFHVSLFLQDFFLLLFPILRTTTRELEDYFPMSSLRFAGFIFVSGVLTLSVRAFVSCWRLCFAWDPSFLLSWGDICNKFSTLHLAQYFRDSRMKCFFT
jgi:hypothetical protein